MRLFQFRVYFQIISQDTKAKHKKINNSGFLSERLISLGRSIRTLAYQAACMPTNNFDEKERILNNLAVFENEFDFIMVMRVHHLFYFVSVCIVLYRCLNNKMNKYRFCSKYPNYHAWANNVDTHQPAPFLKVIFDQGLRCLRKPVWGNQSQFKDKYSNQSEVTSLSFRTNTVTRLR